MRLAATAAVAMAIGAGGTALALAAGGTAATALTTAQIAAKTDPAVVDVESTLGYQGGLAEGTGIVLTPSGEVLTNNHVINGATSIKVRDVTTGKVYKASVVGYDESHDIAVLQLQGASGLPTANLGNSADVTTGAPVVAVGNALGKDGIPSVATGRVTALNQSITASDESAGTDEQLTGLIQTNAGIQPGDSGGPLLNRDGQIIGIDTAASAGANQLSSATATQAYTIPINEAVAIAHQITAGESTATDHLGATALLGVALATPGSAQSGFGGSTPAGGSGVQIEGVQPGTAAAQAGLTAGDTITSVGGHSVTSGAQIRSALTQYHPGDKIGISWTDQSGNAHSAIAVLTTGPAA